MKHARHYVALLLLTTALLTGCITGDEPPEDERPEEEQSEAGLGTVTGKIVTVNLDPVAKAQVRLVKNDEEVANTTTDEEGRYTITNVEPGDYRIQVSAACCKERISVVTVIEDESANVDLQLELLSSDDLQEPRVERYEWTGFLACTVRWLNPEGPHHDVNVFGIPGGASGLNVCGVVEIFAENATGDDFLHVWEAKPGLKTVVAGMDWDAPGAALGDQLTLLMEVNGRPNLPPRYADAEGYSPVEFRVDAGYVVEELDEEDDEGHDVHQYDFDNLDGPVELMFRIFAGGDVNLVYQQPFTVYWDLYYWEEAPEGASALPDL